MATRVCLLVRGLIAVGVLIFPACMQGIVKTQSVPRSVDSTTVSGEFYAAVAKGVSMVFGADTYRVMPCSPIFTGNTRSTRLHLVLHPGMIIHESPIATTTSCSANHFHASNWTTAAFMPLLKLWPSERKMQLPSLASERHHSTSSCTSNILGRICYVWAGHDRPDHCRLFWVWKHTHSGCPDGDWLTRYTARAGTPLGQKQHQANTVDGVRAMASPV